MPHRIFTEAGWSVTIATPAAKPPTVDQLSLGIAGGMPWKRHSVKRYLQSISDDLENPASLSGVAASEFDLVFYPGGHGPMEDLAYDEVSGELLADRLVSGKALALLCHAPQQCCRRYAPMGTPRSPAVA